MSSSKQHCILFYKYHPLTSTASTLEHYRLTQEKLCKSLNLTGRILIGLSENSEGINGTLAGRRDDLLVYVDCMMGRSFDTTSNISENEVTKIEAAAAFRTESKSFFTKINKPELIFDESDFKWSSSAQQEGSSDSWFPDLNVKLVKEIISTGGAFSNISHEETSVGYLTPRQWHEEMKALQQQQKQRDGGKNENEVKTVLIDVRNHKECQIGTFLPGVAIDPNTKTFSQFPKWVRDHSGGAVGEARNGSNGLEGQSNEVPTAAAPAGTASLDNKRILLYCTGGIRCEKASAYVRQMVPTNKGVYHLKGGIHKYLEEFGGKSTCHQESSTFVGKNFVFDRRGAVSGDDCLDDGGKSGEKVVVGQCLYCKGGHDVFLPENVCTVCREPVLVCHECVDNLRTQQKALRGLDDNDKQPNIRVELHCEDHFQIKSCYYTSLHGFQVQELNEQIQQLQLHNKQFEGIGKKGKQKRRTIRKQIEKIEAFIESLEGSGKADFESELQCRNCGSVSCAADCWGFHGGNTRMVNRDKSHGEPTVSIASKNGKQNCDSHKQKERVRTPSNHRPAKRLKREKELIEVETLGLCKPASEYRLPNGLRVPPPTVRVLRSSVKGRWCGKTLRSVMSSEFQEFADAKDPTNNTGDQLNQLINAGLLRVNGIPTSKIVTDSAINASDILLRNMDTIERIVHWHEPPVCVPERISLTKHFLPQSVIGTNEDVTTKTAVKNSYQPTLYCVNKPPSVPVHPAGPYYANSLLFMVEAQEGLTPKSLIPCHRIDRCTSGVLLCTSDADVARLVQGAMTRNVDAEMGKSMVKKLYLARVMGRFPSVNSDINASSDLASYSWHNDVLEINAPIAVQLSDNNRPNSAEEASGMMHRVVAADGKHAISRFKLLFYDTKTNQSIISCCPITGRGHQLRVHLQLIGFPIWNDVEYGGELDSDSSSEQEMQSIQSMLDVSKTASCLHDKSVSDEEARTAISMCKCCRDGGEGVKASFHSAQLLGGGHAIDLHAYKYSINFKNKIANVDGEEELAMEFIAGLPNWASEFNEILSQDVLDWLK